MTLYCTAAVLYNMIKNKPEAFNLTTMVSHNLYTLYNLRIPWVAILITTRVLLASVICYEVNRRRDAARAVYYT